MTEQEEIEAMMIAANDAANEDDSDPVEVMRAARKALLDLRSRAPQAGADLEAKIEEAKDEAANFVFDALAKALGLSGWVGQDGTEEWEGDVKATLYGILRDSGAIDQETDEPAAAALRSERERAQTEVVRDGARFRDFAPEPRAEIPEGYSAPLDTKTTRTLMTERAQTAVPDAGADVRERALQLAVRTWTPWSVSVDLDKRTDTIAAALVSYGEQRAREEREECAKIAETESAQGLVAPFIREAITAAIRSRKEKTDV